MTEKENKLYGLLGENISYSFSKSYFSEKFKNLQLNDCEYTNFDIADIQDFSRIINQHENLKGLNVTIPYKEKILPILTNLDETASEIGAVNTIKFLKNGDLVGCNTDAFGFENSLKPLLKSNHNKAFILGTGGASKAIAYVLKKNAINFKFVSRNPSSKVEIAYKDITEKMMKETNLVINCTPLGTSPKTELFPNIPYHFISENHLLYDLIYNPKITTFLAKGKAEGATIKNGLEMLQLQAEESWRIWNS